MNDEQKPLINISIIGHVDSGKSTLCGQLATRFGNFDKRMQEKLSKIAEENQKGSFTLAYFTDRTEQERSRGVTINTTLVEMKTDKFRINFLDCPGHKDYLKNATSGCKQSDLSIVVLPANFEASLSKDGTLKTHLTLAAVLGSKNFIICINKLDDEKNQDPQALETSFNAACKVVSKHLKPLGVNLEKTIFLPISALHGIGLFKNDKVYPFFEGYVPKDPKPGFEKIMTLEEAINFQDVPTRPLDKPLRIPVSSIAQVAGQGTIVCGRVDYGSIRKGDQVKALPIGLIAEVKSVQAHKKDVEVGECGMNIGFSLVAKDKAKQSLDKKIAAGHMIGPANDVDFQLYPFYIINCISMKGRDKSGHEEKGIKAGYTPVISCGTSNIASKFVKLISATVKQDSSTTTVENPDVILADQKFTALIYPTKQALFESYKNFPTLGKFVCRDSGILVAVGQVLECVTEERAKAEYSVTIADVIGAKSGADKKKGKK